MIRFWLCSLYALPSFERRPITELTISSCWQFDENLSSFIFVLGNTVLAVSRKAHQWQFLPKRKECNSFILRFSSLKANKSLQLLQCQVDECLFIFVFFPLQVFHVYFCYWTLVWLYSLSSVESRGFVVRCGRFRRFWPGSSPLRNFSFNFFSKGPSRQGKNQNRLMLHFKSPRDV